MARRFIGRFSVPISSIGRSPTRPSGVLTKGYRCRLPTFAILVCRTGSAIFRIRISPICLLRTRGEFAQSFPWVQLYTPVNEMYICAVFSARYGWWNEQLPTERSFVTALKHIVKANVLAMKDILDVRPDAIFIQSESSEYFHAENPTRDQTGRDNERRAFSLARPQLRPPHRVRDVSSFLWITG